MGAPVVHFEIMGGEGNQLETFYGKLFGRKNNGNNPMEHGIADTRGQGGIHGCMGPPLVTAAGALRSTPRSTICKQLWIR